MRVLATFAGSFSCGILLSQLLLPGSWMLPCATGSFLAAVAALALPVKYRRRILLMGTALALAMGWNWLYAQKIVSPLELLTGTEQEQVSMVICDYPQRTNYGTRITVKLNDFTCGKAVYYGKFDLEDCVPGEEITDTVLVERADRVRDEEITAFTSRGVFLRLTSQGEPVLSRGNRDSLQWLPARIGHAMKGKIAELFQGDTAGFLTAILTGDKRGLSTTAASDLSQAGLFHVLAVSGMHCGFLLVLVRFLAGPHRRRVLAGVTIPLLWFYAMLTGASPSVIRACVMLSLLLLAPLVRREGDPVTAMTVALMLILLENPYAAAAVSLQLSFGAVAGLLWLTPKLYRALMGDQTQSGVRKVLAASFSATMGALVFTVPMTAWHFGFFVLVSPLSNLLCLWAASLVFLLGLPMVLVGFLSPYLASLLGLLPAMLIDYILTAAHWLANLPNHALYMTNPYLKGWLLCAYLLFAAAYFLRGSRRRTYVLAAVLACLTLTATVSAGKERYAEGLSAMVLDVGQGECVLLHDGGTFAVMDCGSRNSWYHAGGIAADQLAAMGCERLDYLILSHYDTDHVNGVEELLARVPVGVLLLPDTEDDAGLRGQVLSAAAAAHIKTEYIGACEHLPLGQSELTLYPPLGQGKDNEEGLAALCTRGTYDLLITGDMGSPTEKRLAAQYDLPDIETLVVGHHGSDGSSCREFLETLTPETAIISVGSNPYGHPSEAALQRLARAGAKICRTDWQGTLSIFVN